MKKQRRHYSAEEKVAILRRHLLEFIRISGMTHVRTSPFYPQSNGKIERWHKSLKGECIRRERRCRSMTRIV